jgi:hypothetical protein
MASKAISKNDDAFDAVALLAAAGIEVSEVLDADQEIGEGWQVLDKADLVGVPFVITNYRFSDSKKIRSADGTGKQFVILYVLTREFFETEGKSGKWVVTDGSTGLMTQLGEWVTKKGIDLDAEKVPALSCPRGLIVSVYDYTDPSTGVVTEAKTYYLP